MWGCGRTSRPSPDASCAGPISSRNTNGPTMRRFIEGSARRTLNPSPRSRVAGTISVSMAGIGNELCCRAIMALHASVWQATAEMPVCPPLQEDLHVQVCVVGAGSAGLSTAYLLAKAGKSVAVIDDGPIAGGMTQMTSAHLTHAIDDRYYELERLHGRIGARLAAESHTAAIERIEAIVREENIGCDFARVDGYLFLAEGDRVETLEKELDAAQRAGLSRVRRVERAPAFDSGPCLCFPNQGQFHPLKYLAGLTQALHRHGGRVFTGTHVDAIERSE